MKRMFSKWHWGRPLVAVIAVLVLSGLALGGVAVFGNQTKQAANCPVSVVKYGQEKGVVAVIESDNGRTIDINQDEQLFLDLRFIPATGNSWSVREIGNPAVLSEVETIYNPNDIWNSIQGEFSTYVTWIFNATQSGTTQLTMDYGKTENGVVSIDHSFSVTVNVK